MHANLFAEGIFVMMTLLIDTGFAGMDSLQYKESTMQIFKHLAAISDLIYA